MQQFTTILLWGDKHDERFFESLNFFLKLLISYFCENNVLKEYYAMISKA